MTPQSLFYQLAARLGYRVEKVQYQRYGIDPVVDVMRLAPRFGITADLVFDVGANVGQTAAAMRECFPQAAIHCFEPVAATYAELVRNTARDTRIAAHNVALSDDDGEAVIRTFGSSLLSSLEENALYTAGQEAREERCARMRLDAFCAAQGIKQIDLLKIDTEGHDLAVLRGASDMLARGAIGFVLTEFNCLDPVAPGAPGALNDTARLLGQHGYSFIASYIDDVHPRTPPIVVGNALFVKNGVR